MPIINYFLIAISGILITKSTLFWIYLVQLKEYRFKRLMDYFRTTSGKRLLYNPLVPVFTTALRHPKFTKKAIALFALTIILETLTIMLTAAYLPHLIFLILALATLFPLIFIYFSLVLIKPLDVIVRGKILRRATEKMARLKNLTAIGVTGSYGKTSTKEFLAAILATKFKVIKTPEHRNVETGIAQFITESVNDSYDFFVCEMGGYEKGDIATIVKIIKPKIGVLTGANEQHLSLFGSMDNLLSAEGGWELVNEIPKDGFIVANGANKYTREIYEKTNVAKLITSAVQDYETDVWASDIKVYPEHIEFKIYSKKNSAGVQFRADLLGAQNIENILLAAATAEKLGINLEDMVKPVSEFKPMGKTMVLSKLPSGINLIDSSYASNPNAVLAHLEYLKSWGNAKKIVVMPCLIELGTASVQRHEEIGEHLAAVTDLSIITTSEHYFHILTGAKRMIGDAAKDKILFIDNAERIVEQIRYVATKGDVILLEGKSSKYIINKIKNEI